MKSFQWNEYYETGIAEIDEQHLFLVGLLNEYGTLIAEDLISMQELESATEQLKDYAVYHFREEENLMLRSGVDKRHVTAHCRQHRKFIDDVQEFSRAILNRDAEGELAKQLFEYLAQWLVYHILGSDQNMANQIAAIHGGDSAEEAYSKEEHEHKASLGPLLTALQTMFEHVSARNKELILLNQSLEKIVEERTSQLIDANQKLELLSYTDVLTQLPNRRYGLQKLDKAWEVTVKNNLPLACMLVDIDKFKEVNDTAGHAMGDEVLSEIAMRLCQTLRAEDTVCRLGGDEFLIICPETHLDKALLLAHQILVHVQEAEVLSDSYCWKGSVSIGVAERHADMRRSRELISKADQAVYKAKNSGRNRVCFL